MLHKHTYTQRERENKPKNETIFLSQHLAEINGKKCHKKISNNNNKKLQMKSVLKKKKRNKQRGGGVRVLVEVKKKKNKRKPTTTYSTINKLKRDVWRIQSYFIHSFIHFILYLIYVYTGLSI